MHAGPLCAHHGLCARRHRGSGLYLRDMLGRVTWYLVLLAQVFMDVDADEANTVGGGTGLHT
jgi:hypothetical protein